MPGLPPTIHAKLSHLLLSRQYILGISPSPTTPHLFLRHPTAEVTIVDAQSLQPIDSLKGGHTGDVTSVVSEEGAVWSSGKDAKVVRWDERGRSAGMIINGSLVACYRDQLKMSLPHSLREEAVARVSSCRV